MSERTGRRGCPLPAAIDRLPVGIVVKGASLIARVRRRSLVPILLYHSVLPPSDPAYRLLGTRTHNVRPEVLRAHLRILKRHFDVVRVDELAERTLTGRSLGGLGAVTFDDGYRSVLEHAVPVLEELGIPATCFLTAELVRTGRWWRDAVRRVIEEDRVTEFLAFAAARGLDVQGIRPDSDGFYRDTKRPDGLNTRALEDTLDAFIGQGERPAGGPYAGLFCRAEDLMTLHDPGSLLAFGNHGQAHHVLSSLADDEQRQEIALGESVLKSLGLPLSRVFSVPFGGSTYISDVTRSILKDAGYTGYLLSSGHGTTGDVRGGLAVLSRVTPADHPKALARVLAKQAIRRTR
ncbi:polysaccharide deacetylase family protein [Candidatus Bipolaricaulota bacterium]|nr:polysaccharide deacetylase family protein [Candidatus Bipolaricaulota bacterium]